jgi:NAD(P)-dependent dehydrogenase (short-subunit alcohol dehydrogenase family)
VDASRISTHVLDIKDDGAIEELVAEIPVKHGSLDYALYGLSCGWLHKLIVDLSLRNCAGITGGPGQLHEVDIKEVDNVRFSLHFLLCQFQ